MLLPEDLQLLFGNIYYKQNQKSNNKLNTLLDYVEGLIFLM